MEEWWQKNLAHLGSRRTLRQLDRIPFLAPFCDLVSSGRRSLAKAYTSKGCIRQLKYDTNFTTRGIQGQNRQVMLNYRNPWSRAFLEKQAAVHLGQEITVLYGTISFITVFTKARHWIQSWARWIQTKAFRPIYSRWILILSPIHA